MRIIISDKYGIGADQYSFHILQRNKRKRGGSQVTEWIPIKWYTSIESLIEGFIEFRIKMSDVETLTELLKFKHDLIVELHERLPTNFRNAA